MTTENKTTSDETSPGTKTDDTKQPEVKTTTNTPDELKALQEKLASADARIKELNTENEKRRKVNKELEASDARKQKALDILAGKEGAETDPAALAKKAMDEKFRRLALKATFIDAAAKEMHDASFAFGALEREFTDVAVDVETGEVDKAAVVAKLAIIKTQRPFLFVSEQTTTQTKPPPKGSPDGGGQPKGGSARDKWNELKGDPLRQAEATKFYSENRVAILADMK